ncbi:NADH dehydrogenase [ubiquinone] 1 alpha subcomplex subunit 13 [Aricia agestis]|uniref:NADH dehydrogenase [ubiquinone] 1 alpha subcomplex subunit 13 n=1 Tax=Aricia agestis TaxID=91739 RepID=UPI001C204183|nr:NADH dehydrogenase [ubiquinone] 1 alpha subcomplex subunit 13 [Aricia agestis]
MSEAYQLAKKQDLPPPGGYKPIPFKRLPAKQYFSGYTLFAAFVGVTSFGLYLYSITAKKILKHDIEMRSAKLAVYPMLLAERDREYLKQLRRNRDAEAELMKDVPGWEVGTYYGEPVYKNLPKDTLVDPIFHEYYVHSSPSNWFKRAYAALRS